MKDFRLSVRWSCSDLSTVIRGPSSRRKSNGNVVCRLASSRIVNGLLDTHGYNSHTPEDEKTSCKKLHVEYMDSASRLRLGLVEADVNAPRTDAWRGTIGLQERQNLETQRAASRNDRSPYWTCAVSNMIHCQYISRFLDF